jgi:hypothetical protein
MSEAAARRLRAHMERHAGAFDVDRLRLTSRAAAGLARWCAAMLLYRDVAAVVHAARAARAAAGPP